MSRRTAHRMSSLLLHWARGRPYDRAFHPHAPGAARPPLAARHRGHRRRAALPGLAAPSPFRARGAGPRARRERDSLRLAPRARRTAVEPPRLAARRLANRRLPRLRRPHGERGVPRWPRAPPRARCGAADRGALCGSRPVAVPPAAHRGRARRPRPLGDARDRPRRGIAAPVDVLRPPRWRAHRLRRRSARDAGLIALLARSSPIIHNAVSTVKTLAHVVSHGPHCLDGVAAAVAVARYQAGRADVQTRFASNSEVDAVLRGLAPAPGRDHELWITDISWREPETDAHLTRLARAGVRIFWVDHHRSALERFRAGQVNVPFADFVLSEEYAASRLVYDYLARRLEAEGRSEPRFAALGRRSEVADAWRKERRNAVFALYDAKSLSVSLRRSADCEVDLSRLASALGGGGHAAAAGAELPELRTALAEALAARVGERLP